MVFKKIPEVVSTKLGRLTSMTKENKVTLILETYLAHTAALEKANLLLYKIPMIRDLYNQEEVHQDQQQHW
eukprot:1006613-Ditylum_brightwellii.AAC.1